MQKEPDAIDPSPMRIVVLTDLDDTLFQTARKLPPEQNEAVQLAARAANGRDSFATLRQQTLLNWLDPSRCIPVTARGSEAYSRVTLPFTGPAAIVANGALILDADGEVDPVWQGQVRRALMPARPVLDALPGFILTQAARHGLSVRTWLVDEPGCGGVYAVAKSNDDPGGTSLRALVPALMTRLGIDEDSRDDDDDRRHHADGGTPAEDTSNDETHWRLHHNGNNLALMPPGISKALATAYLLQRLRRDGDLLAIGVGDSRSDLPFMRLCDLWMTPGGSQIDLGRESEHDTARAPA